MVSGNVKSVTPDGGSTLFTVTDFNRVQSEKTAPLTALIVDGKSIVCSAAQNPNAVSLIVVTPSERTTVSSDVQAKKRDMSKMLIDDGIVTDVSDVQARKLSFPEVRTPFGILIVSNARQSENAPLSNPVTELGSSMDFKFLQL